MKDKMRKVKKNLVETTNQVIIENRKSKKAFSFFFMSLAMRFSLIFLAFSPTTTVKQFDMTKNLSSAYLNNEVNKMLAETMNAEVVRMLPYDFSAPKNPPNQKNYFTTDDGKTGYKDSTIEVTCWKEVSKINRAEIAFADIKIKHPSQFRRQWANGDYNSSKYQYPTNIFALSNGVVGMSSDFYKFRKYGIIVQYGNVICDKRSTLSRQKYLDVLVIDYNGDFKIWKDNELSEYIKKNGADDIMLSFTFGPALVENGVPYDPAVEKNYPLGESYMHSGRAAIGQLGKLHYLLCTYGNPGLHREDFPAIMAEKGCITAYNLDGGQSGTLVFQNKVFNKIAYMGEQRPMSDVLYFASAE